MLHKCIKSGCGFIITILNICAGCCIRKFFYLKNLCLELKFFLSKLIYDFFCFILKERGFIAVEKSYQSIFLLITIYLVLQQPIRMYEDKKRENNFHTPNFFLGGRSLKS